ncbi:uncharacterized protein [Triticum aestivum]|uniref:uncharacterized protein n=1 Tax=Triticum aestivum TaxID=4565 RepID=UPI001D0146AE|nr:uncharacterized protein LOC123130663 [Triticum aestivum]
MEWAAEQQDLGDLGLAGICCETCRVIHRSILPYGPAVLEAVLLSALLLEHVAAFRGLSSLLEADDGSDLIRFIAVRGAFLLFEGLSMILVTVPRATSPLPGASSGTSPVSPSLALALAFVIFFVFLAALLLLHYEAGLPLQLLGVAACLAGAAYVAPVFHFACVASVLEDAVEFAALRKSRALLAGKFWPAAAVLLTLDGCFVALQLAFARLVLDDALGLGLGFQLATRVATFVALWAVVLLTLAAQPVIYMVFKNHHHEVVDKVHLDYIGEYERLTVDGDNSVELQPVATEQIPETTA